MHDPLLVLQATDYDKAQIGSRTSADSDEEAPGDTNSAESTLYHDYRKCTIFCATLAVSSFWASAVLFYFKKKEAYYVTALCFISLLTLTLVKIGALHRKPANQAENKKARIKQRRKAHHLKAIKDCPWYDSSANTIEKNRTVQFNEQVEIISFEEKVKIIRNGNLTLGVLKT